MFILYILLCYACGAAALFAVVLLLLTLFAGIQLLATKENASTYAERKQNFRNCGKAFLIVLCLIACLVVLLFVLGSQVTFNM